MEYIDEKKSPFKKYVLFVCLGNICRSPAAEGIMKQMVFDDRELRGDRRMREHAAARGYNLNSRARQVCKDDFDRFDYIFAMDEQNIIDLESLARTDKDREKILCLADYLTCHPDYTTVPDPYYGSGKDFDIALDLIEDACKEVVRRLKEGF